uniref:MFS domain-containing protein n=1 Tax=Heligmosomoides polygyrus TaxID=6339 RepID=A0A183G7T4_HELPZ
LSYTIFFGLLCDAGKSVKNSISIQMFSVLIGAMISGQLSDRFGRKKVIIGSLLGVCLFSFATALSLTFLQFNLLRAAAGFFTGGLSAVHGVFLIENIPKHHRMWINTIVTWSPNFIIYPIVAYFCHDWRTLAMFGAVIAIVAVVNMLFLHESPRWLMHHGRIDEARLVLSDIRRKNGQTCEKEGTEIEIFDAKQKKRKHYTFYHLVCTWKYMRWTLTKLSGSLYWNNTLFGIIRWGVSILVGIADYFCRCFGRKAINFIATSSIIAALAIICAVYLQGNEYKISKISTDAFQLYTAKFMITNELFPTAVRNIAVSALSVSSRLGTIIAPQLFYLTDILPVLPYFVLLLVSVLDCVCFQVFLPETKGTNLENHMPPKEQRIFYGKQSIIDE